MFNSVFSEFVFSKHDDTLYDYTDKVRDYFEVEIPKGKIPNPKSQIPTNLLAGWARLLSEVEASFAQMLAVTK